jgi:hypothetical protein
MRRGVQLTPDVSNRFYLAASCAGVVAFLASDDTRGSRAIRFESMVAHCANYAAQIPADAHGTAEMPIWGPLFLELDSAFQTETNQRIASLTAHFKSLQTK